MTVSEGLDPRAFYDSLDSIEAVARLIDPPQHESQTLEYKAAAGPFDEHARADIAKAVCALANSSGGVIVFGVDTARDDRTKPIGFSGFDVRNVELFDQTVATRVQKPVVGLARKVLPTNQPQILVAYIPKSPHSPHQDTVTCRYFHRSGSVSRPMQHDLVELHFGRRLGPVLNLVVQPRTSITEFAGDPPVSNDLDLRLSITNDGQRIGRYVQVVLMFPPKDDVPRLSVTSGRWTDIDHLYQGAQVRQFTENNAVFHPGLQHNILDVRLAVTRAFWESGSGKPLITATIVADAMEPKTIVMVLKP
jgi:hypothetical protein